MVREIQRGVGVNTRTPKSHVQSVNFELMLASEITAGETLGSLGSLLLIAIFNEEKSPTQRCPQTAFAWKLASLNYPQLFSH